MRKLDLPFERVQLLQIILMGVLSIDNISYKTGDYLAFTGNNKAGLLEQKSELAKLLKRDRKGYEHSEIKTIARGKKTAQSTPINTQRMVTKVLLFRFERLDIKRPKLTEPSIKAVRRRDAR